MQLQRILFTLIAISFSSATFAINSRLDDPHLFVDYKNNYIVNASSDFRMLVNYQYCQDQTNTGRPLDQFTNTKKNTI